MAASPSPKAGIKRKIEQVEDAERIEHDDQHDQHDQHDSQETRLLDESEPETENGVRSTPIFQRSYETVETSFADGQHTVEPQFELQLEEMSQRTLDKLNAVPMPQNTSQLPPHRPTLSNDMSAGSVGLSIFLNLEDQTSTQGSDGLQMIEISDKAEEKEVQPQEEHGKSSHDAQKEGVNKQLSPNPTAAAKVRSQILPSVLEDAKIRLQLAMYKVQTRQTHKPFSRLKCEPFPPPKTVSSPSLVTPRRPTIDAQAPSSDATIIAIDHDGLQANPSDIAEAGMAALRARSQDHHVPSSNSHTDPQYFPSSPPLSRLSSTESAEALLPKVVTQLVDKPVTEAQQQGQLSSPPISDGGRDKIARPKVQHIGTGEAATGLLQLMSG